MMEKILLGSSYLAQAIVMATIAFAVISTGVPPRFSTSPIYLSVINFL